MGLLGYWEASCAALLKGNKAKLSQVAIKSELLRNDLKA
jgi:hypothetical protein